jgi:hypothetical protein
MNYNPNNWYWIVAGSTTEVWASARTQYVPLTDATYTAWLAAGNLPTRILNAAELVDVLTVQWLPSVMAQGVTITSTATPALNSTYAVDQASLANISALATGIAAGKGLPGGGSTFNYPDATGTMQAFTSANFLAFAAAIETYDYAYTQALAALVSGSTATLPASALTIP